jgi:hypothetical protein
MTQTYVITGQTDAGGDSVETVTGVIGYIEKIEFVFDNTSDNATVVVTKDGPAETILTATAGMHLVDAYWYPRNIPENASAADFTNFGEKWLIQDSTKTLTFTVSNGGVKNDFKFIMHTSGGGKGF